MTLTPEAALGILALFGITILGILLILKRFGIIKFAGAGNGAQCPDHNGFCDAFTKLKAEHIIMNETIKQHEKQLEDGKTGFREIKADIAQININIARIMQKLEIK